MKLNNKMKLSMLATLAPVMAMIHISEDSLPRDSTIPTEAELKWIASLPPYRNRQWKRCFARGLTAEERRYVDTQLET